MRPAILRVRIAQRRAAASGTAPSVARVLSAGSVGAVVTAHHAREAAGLAGAVLPRGRGRRTDLETADGALVEGRARRRGRGDCQQGQETEDEGAVHFSGFLSEGLEE